MMIRLSILEQDYEGVDLKMMMSEEAMACRWKDVSISLPVLYPFLCLLQVSGCCTTNYYLTTLLILMCIVILASQ